MHVVKGQPSIAVLVKSQSQIGHLRQKVAYNEIIWWLLPLCKLAKPVATLTYFANIMYLFQVCISNHCYVNNVSRMTNLFVFTDGPRFGQISFIWHR